MSHGGRTEANCRRTSEIRTGFCGGEKAVGEAQSSLQQRCEFWIIYQKKKSQSSMIQLLQFSKAKTKNSNELV